MPAWYRKPKLRRFKTSLVTCCLQDDKERKLAALIMERVANHTEIFDFDDVANIVEEATASKSFAIHKTLDTRLQEVYTKKQSFSKVVDDPFSKGELTGSTSLHLRGSRF
jgi:hypothetical protein